MLSLHAVVWVITCKTGSCSHSLRTSLAQSLPSGADQEHKTDEMHTALMEASMDGHVDVARLLLDHGAQVGAVAQLERALVFWLKPPLHPLSTNSRDCIVAH